MFDNRYCILEISNWAFDLIHLRLYIWYWILDIIMFILGSIHWRLYIYIYIYCILDIWYWRLGIGS